MSLITRESVLQMDLKSIFAAMKDPATSNDMTEVIRKNKEVPHYISGLMQEAKNREEEVDAQLARTVPPSTEALAAEAQAMAVEPVVEAVAPPVAPVVDSTLFNNAEDAEWLAVGITVVRDASGKAVRYVEEYQVAGEDGKAIGRATHLEARTLQELAAKKREVHTQATRAFHRLKQQKLTFKQDKTILTPEQISEAARVALESKDSNKITDVIHEVIETEYKKREEALKEKENREVGRAISNEFMRRHLHDYNPCEANQKEIGEYFAKHNLDFTLDNLEAAFEDLMEQGNKLAKVETLSTKHATVAANPAPVAAVVTPATPVIPAAETPATVPASVTPAQPQAVVTPVVEATVTPSVAAPNVQPATRRPGVGGSIVPGSLSAQRPGTPEPALARREFLQIIAKMDPQVMKNKLKTDPQFVKQLASYGIPIK